MSWIVVGRVFFGGAFTLRERNVPPFLTLVAVFSFSLTLSLSLSLSPSPSLPTQTELQLSWIIVGCGGATRCCEQLLRVS